MCGWCDERIGEVKMMKRIVRIKGIDAGDTFCGLKI